MAAPNVFSQIALTDQPLFKVVERPIRSALMWNRILQRELKQDTVECRALDCWIKKTNIKVKWVVGDVLGIEIWLHSDLESPGEHTPMIMYINATGLDLIFDRMRENKGSELLTFANQINKNFHQAYQAAILIVGFIDRAEKKKLIYNARCEWRKLMKSHTEEKQIEIIEKIKETIADSEARKTLLSWRKL